MTTPSNLQVTLQDLIFEEQPYSGELHVVVRLLAPLIAGDGIESSELREDMDWACETWGLPAAATLSTAPDRVVIEMMEAPTERGVPNREVRQLFEVYRLEGSVCIWELY